MVLVTPTMIGNADDPNTLEWLALPGSQHVPHEISQWTDDMCLLVVKYVCVTTQHLATFSCRYCHNKKPVEAIFDNWLEERLNPFVERKEVGSRSPDTLLICGEEYCHKNPKDTLERNILAIVEKEGLVLTARNLAARLASQAPALVRLHAPAAPW